MSRPPLPFLPMGNASSSNLHHRHRTLYPEHRRRSTGHRRSYPRRGSADSLLSSSPLEICSSFIPLRLHQTYGLSPISCTNAQSTQHIRCNDHQSRIWFQRKFSSESSDNADSLRTCGHSSFAHSASLFGHPSQALTQSPSSLR